MEGAGLEQIAHINSSGESQPLEAHLRGVSELAERFCSSIGLAGVGRYIGLLHDLGKAAGAFRDYISGLSDASRGEVDHSTAGAQLIVSGGGTGTLSRAAAVQMMALAVMSHHSGLIDCVSSDGACKYMQRLGKDRSKTHADEAQANLDAIVREAEGLRAPAVASLSELIDSIVSGSSDVLDKGYFRLGLLSRFILSCLVDADHIDTADFERGTRTQFTDADWDGMLADYYAYMDSFPKGDDTVSVVRRDVSAQCFSASARGKGVYTLSVPTGGGKTLASLRFALEHAKRHSMKRIVYVIPYTSIIEQNAAVARLALNDPGSCKVREYHSNVDAGGGEDGGRWAYSSDSWDAPVIFTTMVQFMDTLFSSGTRVAKRMHSLADSILIFDEVQTVPVKLISMFDEAVNFLTGWCGSTALLCTATQPLLDRIVEYPLALSEHSEIISDGERIGKSLERVEFTVEDGVHGEDGIAEAAIRLAERFSSVLVIVNTKSMAKKVHRIVSASVGPDVSVRHLSTNMCAAHRRKVLDSVVGRLGRGRLICVSTQLIEAGVDVDFEAVVRSMAGLDSIAQAAGRCNRNGRMSGHGEVVIIRTDERIERLKDIYEGRKMAESVLREYGGDILGAAAMSRYFEYYYTRRRSEMRYATENHERSVFDMLSANSASVNLAHRRGEDLGRTVLRQSFQEANRRFTVIDPLRAVIVPYDGDARDVIAGLCSDAGIDGRRRLLRRAQRYAVNTYAFDELRRKGAVREIGDGSGIFALLEGYYDSDYGLSDESSLSTMVL